jgi:hypothetical protein
MIKWLIVNLTCGPPIEVSLTLTLVLVVLHEICISVVDSVEVGLVIYNLGTIIHTMQLAEIMIHTSV